MYCLTQSPQTFIPFQRSDPESIVGTVSAKAVCTGCLDILPVQAFLYRTPYIQFSRCNTDCLVVAFRYIFTLAWGQKLSIQGRASFSGSGVEEDRRVNQRVVNFPIAENPIFSLAIAKKPHSSCHKSTSSKACPAWHSA